MVRKILIVDDEAMNRQILNRILRDTYDVLEAENGEEALSILNRSYKFVSAVLLDIFMPDMDGYEVLRQMRANPALAQIPVIMITSSEDEDTRIQSLALGANDFVIKPYNPAIIKHCLRNNIALRENAAIVNAVQLDKLTGLYTRETFFDKVKTMIKHHKPGHYVMACFDIDKFKVINDQYGSQKGDEALQHIATTFRKGFEPHGGICCRMMADNFAVLYPVAFMDSAEIEEIRRKASIIAGIVSPLTFSIGRYIVDDLSLTVSAMYERAALAEDSVKGRYDVHIAQYDETMRDNLIRTQQIIFEMEAALTQKQFEVWFQPQYNHASGALIGAEALVRWRHPHKGLIPPGDFIPVFEQNGFIYEMDKYVWEEACRYLREWLDQGGKPLPVSVNVSRHDIFCPDFIDVITGLRSKYDIPVDLLRLEITESAFAKSTEQIIMIVKQLINLGFTIEIDDFGSGYSSLNTLKSVPAQVLKLDMRFLENDNDSQRGGSILESIVRMSKWLGMSIIAEGVEEKVQADFLKSIGCNYVQGYLYARPMPAPYYKALCLAGDKEEHLLALETVENLDNNAFWDPRSIDTLIFNSYVGGACIFEYHNGKIEIVRVNDEYAKSIGCGESCTTEYVLGMAWEDHMDEEAAQATRDAIQRTIDTGASATYEAAYTGIPGASEKTYLRTTFRLLTRVGDRYLLYSTNENITLQRQAEMKEHAAEQKRLEAAEQMQAIMNNVNGGITAVNIDDDGMVRFIFSNDEYYAMQGYTRQQFAAEVVNAFELVHPDDRERIKAIIAETISQHGTASYDYRVRKRNGDYFHVRSDVSVANIASIGKNVLLSIMTDITALVEAERQAARSAQQIEAIMQNISGGVTAVTIVDGEPQFLFANDQFYALYACTKEQYEAEYPSPFDPICPEDKERVMEEVRRASLTRQPFSVTYRNRRRDGSIVWLQSNMSIISLPGIEEPVQLSVANDVTELYMAEQKKQEAAELLRIRDEEYALAIANSGNLVYRYIVATRSIIDISPEASALFGHPAQIENVPESIIATGTVAPDSVDILRDFYARINRGDKTGSMTARRKVISGAYRWFSARFSTIFNSDGDPVSAIILFVDVTEAHEEQIGSALDRSALMTALSTVYPVTVFFNLTQRTYQAITGAEHALMPDAKQGNISGFVRAAAQRIAAPYAQTFLATFNHEALLLSLPSPGKAIRLEYQQISYDDQLHWVEAIALRVQNDYSSDVIGVLLCHFIDEQKAVEDKLKQALEITTEELSRKRIFQKVIDATSPDGTLVLTTNGTVLYIGGTLIRELGYTEDEFARIQRDRRIGFVLDEDYGTVYQDVSTLNPAAQPRFEQEFRACKKDGSIICMHESGTLTHLQDGVQVYVVVATDVTERREMEDRLRVSEEELRLAMAQMDKMVGVFDPVNRVLILPEAYAKRHNVPTTLTNVPESGKNDKNLDTVALEQFKTFYEAIFRGDKSGVSEFYSKHSDGEMHWERWEFFNIFDAGGKPNKTIIAIEDTTAQHDAQARIENMRKNEEMLQLVVEHSARVIYRYDILTKEAFSVDPWVSDKMGLPGYVANMPEGLIDSGIIIAEDAEYARELFASARTRKNDEPIRLRVKINSGSIRWLDVKYSFIHEGVALTAAVISFSDVTELHEREVTYAAYRQTAEDSMATDLIYFESDVSADVVEMQGGKMQSALIQSVGKKRTHLNEEIINTFFVPDEREKAREFLSRDHLLAAYAIGRSRLSADWQVVFADKSQHWIRTYLQMVADPYTQHIKAFVSAKDITAEKQAALAVQKQAETDGMTGLYNKTTTVKLIKQRLDRKDDSPFVFLIADLDNLKSINDNLGHDQGDEAIRYFARLLREQFRKTDIVGRIGGDEFAAFLDGGGNEIKLRSTLFSFMRKLTSVRLGTAKDLAITCSIGLITGINGKDSYEELFKKADKALYHVKRNGKNDFAFYIPDMEQMVYEYKGHAGDPIWQSDRLDRPELKHLLSAVSVLYPLVISVNLSQNTYYMMQYDSYPTKKCFDAGRFDDLINEGVLTFHPEDRASFNAAFARQNLLAAYARGDSVITHVGRQLGDDGAYHYIRTDAIFIKDTDSDDILEITMAREIESGSAGKLP